MKSVLAGILYKVFLISFVDYNFKTKAKSTKISEWPKKDWDQALNNSAM